MRSANAQADRLAKLATSLTVDLDALEHIEILEASSIEEPLLTLCATSEPSWMDPIVQYLKMDALPTDTSAVCQIKRTAPHYTLVGERLYKRSFTLSLFKCLLSSEAKYALQEVHEGLCGNHLGGRALAHKVLRHGYYWPNMQKDAVEYVRVCDSYQRHAPTQHLSATKLAPLISPWPFER